MTNYKITGGVPVIGTLTQPENSEFPIVIADDIELTDGSNLEEEVIRLRTAIFGPDGEGIPMSEIDDTIKSDETTWSSEKISSVISDLKDEIPTFDSVYTKDDVYTKTETENAISEAIANQLSTYITQAQLQGAIENAVSGVTEATRQYTDQKFSEADSRLNALEEKVGDGFEPIGADWIIAAFQDS